MRQMVSRFDQIELRLVPVVIVFNFFLRDLNVRSNLVTDHLLRHDLIANASFEVFEGNAL